MFVRSLARYAEKAAVAASQPGPRARVPDCLTSHGSFYCFHFLNHPGVMAVSALLELRQVVRMRANFTQETIDQMKDYDVELARKAQIAYDNGLAINFIDMERIEDTLPRLLKEKEQLVECRKEILARPVGDYSPLKANFADFKPENFKLKMPETYNRLVGEFLEQTAGDADKAKVAPTAEKKVGEGDKKVGEGDKKIDK